MKVKFLLLALPVYFLSVPGAQAIAVQLSFTGTITEEGDFGTNSVFNNTVHVGDSVSGALVVDYALASTVAQGNGVYNDPSGQTYWITNSWVTINGTTYSANAVPGYTYNYSWDKASATGSSTSTSSLIYANKVGSADNDTSRYDNLIGIGAQYAVPFNGNLSLTRLAMLVSQANSQNSQFSFRQGKAISPSGSWGADGMTLPPDGTAIEGGYVIGSVNSIKITTLNQPSSQVPVRGAGWLLAPALAGLGCLARKKTMRMPTCVE